MMKKKENIQTKGSSKNIAVVPKASAPAQRRPSVSTIRELQQPAQKQNLQPNLNKNGRGNNPRATPTAEQNKVRAVQILHALKRIITTLLLARRAQAANNAKSQKDNNARRQMNNVIVANLLRTFLNKKLKNLQPPAEQSKPEVKKKKHSHLEESEQTAVIAKENESMAANNFIVSNVNKSMPEPTPPPPPRVTEPKKPSLVSRLLGKALVTLLMSQLAQIGELLAAEKGDAKAEITAKELAQSIGAMTDDALEEFISTMTDEELAGLIGIMTDDETQGLTNAIAADKEQAEFNVLTAGATQVQPNLQAQDSLLKAAASKTEQQSIADEATANKSEATVKSPANR